MISACYEQYQTGNLILSANAGRSGSFEVTITDSSGKSDLVHSNVGGDGHVYDKHAQKIIEALKAAFEKK